MGSSGTGKLLENANTILCGSVTEGVGAAGRHLHSPNPLLSCVSLHTLSMCYFYEKVTRIIYSIMWHLKALGLFAFEIRETEGVKQDNGLVRVPRLMLCLLSFTLE